MHLTATFHGIAGHSDTICNTDDCLEKMIQLDDEMKYIRTVLNKQHHIRSVYAYNDDGNLRYCYFEFIPDNEYKGVPIGREYTFSPQGDITGIINHEEGYSICHKQAMYIGDRYSKRKASKEFPERILGRGTWQDKKIWEYHYTNRKRQKRMLVIDGCSGKILKKMDVFVTY